MDPRQSLLAAWADLAPSANTAPPLQVAKLDEFLWLGTNWSLFATPGRRTLLLPRSPTGALLAQIDALHRDAHVLREGWVFLSGKVERDGVEQPVLIPLLSRPVRLESESAGRAAARSLIGTPGSPAAGPQLSLTVDGEADLLPLIEDLDLRAELTDRAEFGRGAFTTQEASPALIRRMPALRDWILQVAAASGLVLGAKTPIDTQDPRKLVGHIHGIRAVVGSAIYAAPEVPRPVAATALDAWSQIKGLDRTSFGVLYARSTEGSDVDQPIPTTGSDAVVHSPFVLSPSQERVVLAARSRPLTVVSGAPGNGKSHAVAAVALDHVARGQSVLIATRSRFAARAIADLIHRVPGPNALRFGDIIEGSSVVDELNDHLLDAPSHDAETELARAVAARDGLKGAIRSALEMELMANEVTGSITAMRVLAPNAFELDADLTELARLADAAVHPPTGLFAERRARHATQELSDAVGASVSDPAAVAAAIERARHRRASLLLDADGGTAIGPDWDLLRQAEDRVHLAVGAAAREQQDRGRRARGAVAELLAALRAGRGKRRTLLASIDADALTAAVPLWIGTLGDIEDLLPARPASFDLVILDEAAHVDQPGAAPALLRAERAVVVGDPRQLRHVSFLSDNAIAEAMAAHDVADLTATVDLRRNSVFDRAAAVSPILDLVEHYRSVPHLVEFPITEFYRDRVDVMTRRPDNDAKDVIDVLVPADTGRKAEIDAVVELLRSLATEGPHETVGVISPFREHADALQAAVLANLDEADIRRLGLRVGTVHGFQGAERDAMVLALGLSPDDPGGRSGFVENRNLFNVMVTRARNRATVVTTVTQRKDGLLARFLAHANRTPSPLPDRGTDCRWAAQLAGELARAGVATRSGYAVGPWMLELVLDDADEAIAFETRVYGGDPALHIARHQALTGLGWRFVEAYPTRWDHDVARAALELPALIDAARRQSLPAPPLR